MGLFGRYAKPAPQVRHDGWVNLASGIGTQSDKTAHGFYVSLKNVPPGELSALYYNEPIAAKIVDTIVDESMNQGYGLDGVDPDDAAGLLAAADALDLDTHVTEACKWGRLYGGCITIKGLLDGLDPLNPIRPGSKAALTFLNELDRRDVEIAATYSDASQPSYGKDRVYRINTVEGGSLLVDASRTIRWDGVTVDRRKKQELGGWSLSVLQRVYEKPREFGLSWGAANLMLVESTQGIFKLEGLRDALTGGETEALMRRMRLTDSLKGVGRSLLLDSEGEEFSRVGIPLTGTSDLIDRFMMGIASAADMPVTKLFGRSAAGMNATGEGDRADWHKQVSTFRDRVMEPRLVSLYKTLAAGMGIDAGNLSIEWPPLEEASEKEKAEVYSMVANADKVYVDLGVVEPERVAITRWGQGFYDGFAAFDVNLEELEAALNVQLPVEEGQKLELTPSDLANVTTVAEARASVGLPPLPDAEANKLTVAAYAEQQAAKQALVGEQQGQGSNGEQENGSTNPNG